MLRGNTGFLRLPSQPSPDPSSDPSSVPTSLPLDPPQYQHQTPAIDEEDLIHDNIPHEPIESFEIEDTLYNHPPPLFKRLLRIFLSFAAFFNAHLIRPLVSCLEPAREGYSYISTRLQTVTTKLGNPLVVNRLAYVVFVSIVMYFITESGLIEGVDGVSGGGGGFSPGRFYDTLVLGESIRDLIDRKQMKENLEYLSSMPTIAGTRGDWTIARYVKNFLKINGLKPFAPDEVDSFMNYPNPDRENNYVELADGLLKATLFETSDLVSQNFAYNPNSKNSNGDIEASFVFANYGTPLDFTLLQDGKVLIKDKIVLILYGGPSALQTFPEANKVALAYEQGAKAVVFISPHVNGSGDDTIRRENMALLRSSPGEVLLDNWSAEHHRASRVPFDESTFSPKIPTIPVSNRDGIAFLNVLKGEGIKFDSGFFSGKSDSPHTIKLKVTNHIRSKQAIWNIGATLEGREQPEKGIIIGASRDSVCHGTMSSNTGTVVLLELVRVFTSLQRQYHWSPSRSIHFVSFDGSAYNAAGLADWVGQKIDQLRSEGFAYIDLSDAVTGDLLSIKANPLLHAIIKNALRRVKDKIKSDASGNAEGSDLYSNFQLQHDGSDRISNNMIELKNYIPFINMVNVPALEIKFTGSDYPQNLCGDDFSHFERAQVDPIMAKHAQLTNLLALIALELAEAPIIPYAFTDLASSLVGSFNDLQKYADEMINSLQQPNKPNLHYEALIRALNNLSKVDARHQSWVEAWKHFISESAGMEPSMLAMNRWRFNDNSVLFNSEFLTSNNNPRRKHYKNALFGVQYMAPSSSDETHDWNSFPLIRDALYDHDFERAQQLIDDLAILVELAAHRIQLD